MNQKTQIKVGLFSIGLDTYWPQFKGLLDRLTGYQARIAGRLQSYDVTLVDAGMVDSPEKARAAASLLALRRGELCVCQIMEMLGLAPSRNTL